MLVDDRELPVLKNCCDPHASTAPANYYKISTIGGTTLWIRSCFSSSTVIFLLIFLQNYSSGDIVMKIWSSFQRELVAFYDYEAVAYEEEAVDK